MDRATYKFKNILLCIIFFISIYVPFLFGLIQEDSKVSIYEKRSLAIPPDFPASIKDLTAYPSAFENYYSDHFGLRERLTKNYFKMMSVLNGHPVSSNVTFGKDGWMFLGSVKPGYTGYNDPIGDAINVNLYSEDELEKFEQSIMAVKNWLAKKGIEYILFIAPNKHTIYFENLPEYITRQHDESATDQLINHLRKNTDLIIVDVRNDLLEEKKKHQMYYKTDTHWNHFSANRAQFIIMQEIEKLFPGRISPELISSDDMNMGERVGGDLAGFAKLEGIVEQDPIPVFEETCELKKVMPIPGDTRAYTVTCDKQELNAIIFRDSFFIALEPYFQRKFYRSTYLLEKLNYPSLKKYVETEEPDIVIEEWVERVLPHIPNNEIFIKDLQNTERK